MRLRLSNLAKEKKIAPESKNVVHFSMTLHSIFLFYLTFPVFAGLFEKIPIYLVFADFSFFFDAFVENVVIITTNSVYLRYQKCI